MSVSPIVSPLAGLPGVPSLDALSGAGAVTGTGQVGGTQAAGAVDNGFGDVLAGQVDALQTQHTNSAEMAQRAVVGDVKDVHDYMIAATQTQLATETVVALRNKAVEAFNEILRMPV